MAAWQFEFQLIPAAWAKANNYQADALYREDYITPEIAWLDNQPSVNTDELFLQLLAEGESWHPDLSVWGDSNRNEINLWREGGEIKELSVRFDLRAKLNALPAHVIDAAGLLECALFVPQRRVVFDPDLHTLLATIRESRAAKFVSNS